MLCILLIYRTYHKIVSYGNYAVFFKYLIYEYTSNILGAQCKVNLRVILTRSPNLVMEMDNIGNEIQVFDTKCAIQQPVSPYHSICCQSTVCRRCVFAVL
jgi:hypothetical protein